MSSLGSFYRDGLGVAQDYQHARRWYQKAAAAGNVTAMSSLGRFYHDGLGVARDYQQARQWYEKAAVAGSVMAMRNLGRFYRYGLGVAQDYQQARQWYEKAAAGAAAISPTVLNPASRPMVFRTLKRYEATLPARVQHLPNSTSTITAWRAWRVKRYGPKLWLMSTGYSRIWEPKIRQEARCIRSGVHIAPYWNCHCGFWGFKSVEEMLHVLQIHDYHDFGVLGTVSLWGRVIETEHGFRAQYAYPKELWLDEEMLELGWTYNIPIRAATEPMK
jgi:hypothetical protein